VIGYYAHHRGAGHVNRALAILEHLDGPVTILTSAPRPADYAGDWVSLPLDDADRETSEPTANGALHWAPLRSPGLADRMALIARWLEASRPDVVVVDVSVEVALLVRLHGVPVVTVAQPGDRGDSAHSLGYRASSAIIAMWPHGNDALRVAPDIRARIETVGAISRIPVTTGDTPPREPERIAVLGGLGTRGESALSRVVGHARAALPGRDWIVLDDADAATVARALRTSSVVFAHCGQNAIAEIAASRVPAVFVPEDRPHDEQAMQAAAFRLGGHPATVIDGEAPEDWAEVLRSTAALDGDRWESWCDGGAAGRAAAVIGRVAATGRRGA
jgi:predicted glycosyltransferase